MTGPEHYREAECLVADVEAHGGDYRPEGRADAVALAQVHATLALAAATALSSSEGVPLDDWRAWAKACAEPKDAPAAQRDGEPGGE